MAKYLTSVYVSGWQCSSTASTSNEPGPDVADYPYDTVPNKAPSNWDWICSYGQGPARPDIYERFNYLSTGQADFVQQTVLIKGLARREPTTLEL